MDVSEEAYELRHIGIKRRSGRYPWGSGNNEEERSRSFKTYMEKMHNEGYSDKQIREILTEFSGEIVSSTEIRATNALATEVIRANNSARAAMLKAKGLSNGAIAEIMGLPKSAESTVRGWLKPSEDVKEKSLHGIASHLKEQNKEKPYLDVGLGEHLHLGVTLTKFNTALAMLKDEGYHVHDISVPQQNLAGQNTHVKVLTHPNVTWKEAREAVIVRGELQNLAGKSDDGGISFSRPGKMPRSISSKEIQVRYAEDGGKHMDGVIELRRDVPSLSLGANRYGQVRIAVDGTHFLKGMAMYADDLPAGINIRYNSNKSKTDPKILAEGKHGAMKPMETFRGKIDERNPFKSATYPQTYKDKDGKEHDSYLNIVGTKEKGNIEGRWDEWSRTLSSQMLSKQPLSLASTQLHAARVQHEKDLNEIRSLTNPVVRKRLLEEFADNADAAAVHLKAAKLPRQANMVLLPMNSMRPNEIYAPSFKQGERVALVRHPHAGPFEIPELTVNNRNRTAQRILENAQDAVGVHHSVAAKLSGADFDGDTVLVIPNSSGRVKSRDPAPGTPLAALRDFDPKSQYKIPDDDTTTPRMSKRNTQTEMGKISNLITDMTIHRANDEEIAKAVRHSMVVIDAEKHGLNYKQSERDNSIALLKARYQGGSRRGAETLISRAGAKIRYPQYKDKVDPKTGKKIHVETFTTEIDPKTGKTVYVKTRKDRRTGQPVRKILTKQPTTTTKRLAYIDDARKIHDDAKTKKRALVPMEELYATHSNALKAMANQARKEAISTKMPSKASPAAKSLYAKEVESLRRKLEIAQRNAPLERRAQVLSGVLAKNYIDDHRLEMDDDDIKKVRNQTLQYARQFTGADKQRVHITDNEWEAIQARAIGHTVLDTILRNADMERVKQLATPHARSSLTPGQLARARQLQQLGRPLSQIAEELGIPRSTIIDNLNR